MKRSVKHILILLGAFVAAAVLLLGSVLYTTSYRTAVVDTASSPDGAYALVLQSVGEPYFPFGAAPGRLVLKNGEATVAKVRFEIANDGAAFGADSWSVTWYDDRVEVLLSGSEQYDELVTLYFDGQTDRRDLTTHYGLETESATAEDVATDSDVETVLFPEEEQITAGYRAIYALYADNPLDDFEVWYGAQASSSRCILSEDDAAVDYLVYNGKSANEQCGLYVRYQSAKRADGTWSEADGSILDMYAYVYESGDVVSSGKTSWSAAASDAYREAAGE